MKKMLLNLKECKELKEKKVVQVKRRGFDYLVKVDETTDTGYKVEALPIDVIVIAPLLMPKNIVLTGDECKELKEKKKTTHTKGGVTYTITYDENENPVASVENEYSNEVLKASDF